MADEAKIKATVELITELGKEVEATDLSATDAPTLVKARAVINEWIGEARGVVVSPAFGRVTIVDANGNAAAISSADLAFRLIAAGITQTA